MDTSLIISQIAPAVARWIFGSFEETSVHMKHFLSLAFSFLISSLWSQNLTDSLEARFPFDGNLVDSTGNNNDLKLDIGAVAYAPVSGSDYALQLSGADRMVSSTAFDNTWFTETSISLWFKNNDAGANGQILVQGAFLGFGLRLEASGKIVGFCGGSSVNGYQSLKSDLDDNIWHHVVLTSNGSITKLYIDGSLDGSIPENLYTGNGGINEVIFLGMTSFSTYPFTGLINDLRIYSRELDSAEVSLLFNPSIGISEMATGNQAVSIYPNPGKGEGLSISLAENLEISDASVFNLSGHKVGELIFREGVRYAIRPTLPPGSYILKLDTQMGIFNQKIVVQQP